MKNRISVNLLVHLGVLAIASAAVCFVASYAMQGGGGYLLRWAPLLFTVYVWVTVAVSFFVKVLRVYRGRTVSHTLTVLTLPAKSRISFKGRVSGNCRIVLFFCNVSPECVEGICVVRDVLTNYVMAEKVFLEPERLLQGVTSRRRGWWGRGTGSSIRPLYITLRNDDHLERELALDVDLKWSFLETRLEYLIPKNKELIVECLLKS